MTSHPILPLALRQELQRIGRALLQKALDALAQVESDEQEPPPCPAEEIQEADLLDFPIRAARDAHLLLDRQPADQTWGDSALRRLSELLASYLAAAKRPATPEERQAWLVSLTAVTAGVMIPLLGRAARYDDALDLADAHYNLVLSKNYDKVAGAGKRSPGTGYILLSPVLWSFVGHITPPPRDRPKKGNHHA